MRLKNSYYLFIGILFSTVIFSGCRKKEISERKVDVPRMIEIYEEIGRRHNDFLARSFPQVKEKLTQRHITTRSTGMISQDEVYDVMMEVSSENLTSVVDYPYSSQQLLAELEQNLPQELILQDYPTTQTCLEAFVPEANISPTFAQALQELDLLLDQCTNYDNTSSLIQSFDRLREKYIPLLTQPAELEAYIAGTTLGKHSLSYWAENEEIVMGMFRDTGISTDNYFGKRNPVKSDVKGMVTGAIKGAIDGMAWGLFTGIGALWGGIAMGVVGAAATGCISSLGAGLWNAIIQ